MKDPLRYFLDEGFGTIYSFLNESGRLEARIRWVNEYKNFIPSFSTTNGTTVLTIGGVSYVTDDEFMGKYTVEVDDREAAETLIAVENMAWKTTKEQLNTLKI